MTTSSTQDRASPDQATVDRWIDTALWNGANASGSLVGIVRSGLQRAAIRHYIQGYFREHGRLPLGVHHIKVTHHWDGSAELQWAPKLGSQILRQHGTVELDLAFPPQPVGPHVPLPTPPEPLESRWQRHQRHDPATCPLCNVDPERVFLETTWVRGVWTDADGVIGSALLFTCEAVADWFGARRDEQVALAKSIDVARDALHDRLLREKVAPPTGFRVAFETGSAVGAPGYHLHLRVTPVYGEGGAATEP